MPGASRRHAAVGRLNPADRPQPALRLWQIAAGVLCGNLLLHQLPALPSRSIVLIVSLLAVIAWRSHRLAAIAVLAFCWTGWVAQSGLAARWPAEADGQDVALFGWIDTLPRRDTARTVFSLRVSSAASETPLRRVRLSWYEPSPELVAGQWLEIEARLRAPRGLMNPGGFDYERWLFLERFDATGYVRAGRPGAGGRTGISQAWLKFRSNLVERLGRRIVDTDAATLLQALALGERSGFENRHWTTLQRTGTSHLVAVSGLHIGMMAAFAYFLTLRLTLLMPYALARKAHEFAAASCIVMATAYAALAGFSLPTRRALVMLLVVQALVISRRRWPLGAGLGLASIVILAFDPLASLTASFWLSFGAVAVLLAASARILKPAAPAKARWLSQASDFCRLQWALTLGLAPFVIWYFGQFSVVSLVVNLVAIPLFSLVVVPLAFVTALIAAFGIDGIGIEYLSGAVAGGIWRVLESLSQTSFAAYDLPRPPIAVFLLALVAIAMSTWRHRLPVRRLALLGLVPLAVDHTQEPAPGFARATILDVGHGLSVAIETASHRMLYDAGPSYRSGFDAGEEIVGPALAAIGRRPLDLMILSHGDSDHAGGAAAIVDRYPGVAVLAGPDVDQVPAALCRAGQNWTWDQVRFRVLHPPTDTHLSGNDSSCVVSIETIAGSILLTGDVESRAESQLAGIEGVAADIVVVPHHGSLTSSTMAFVEAVRPSLAVVSAGYDNRWGFPRPEVVRRWEGLGATLLVTGNQGAVDIVFSPEGIEVTPFGNLRRRYWQAKREPVSGAVDVSAL